MGTKTKIAIVALVAISVFIYVGYWYRSLAPVPDLTHQIEGDSERKKDLLKEVSDDTPAEENGGLVYRQVQLPSITLQEYTPPNLISAKPAHTEAVSLGNLRQVELRFSQPIEHPSQISVFIGDKAVARGGSASPDALTLAIPIEAGSFSARSLETGVYEVFYDACFVGDTCYKGQYAFYGVQERE